MTDQTPETDARDETTEDVTPEVTDAPESEDATEEASDTDASDDATEDAQPEALKPIEETEFYDDVFPILYSRALQHAENVNEAVAFLNANSSDLLTVLEAVEADASDAKVKAANDRIEELESEVLKIKSLRREYAMDKAKGLIAERKDDDAIKAAEERHAKARTAWRDYVKVFKSNYEGHDITPYLPEVKNLQRKGTTKGSGGSRMRGFTLWVVDGVKVGGTQDGKFVSTASDAAKAAKVDLAELQNEYKRIHGDDPKSWPQQANFEFKGHKFEATREDKDAAKGGADVSPASVESTNGTATS